MDQVWPAVEDLILDFGGGGLFLRESGIVQGAALRIGQHLVGLLDLEEDLGLAGGLVLIRMQPLG
jgi:hypothetical protein